MKEIKILAILVVVVGVLYWGVEPLAHSIFHPKVANVDFEFKDLKDIDLSVGDAARGKELLQENCLSCHTLKAEGLGEMLLTPFTPDLSTAGAIYDEKFLANLIIDPESTVKLSHKFKGAYPMTPLFTDNVEVDAAHIVAYLKSIGDIALKREVIDSAEYAFARANIEKSNLSEAVKSEQLQKLESNLSNKAVFINACARCHSMKYDKVISTSSPKDVEEYLGAVAPDLSTIIRARSKHYLEYFINDPQKKSFKEIQQAIINSQGSLPANDKKSPWQDDQDYSNLATELGVMPAGLSMPRVGLNEHSQEKVLNYIESIGDAKKEERENLGVYIMIFFGIMTIFAYLWKRRIWSEVH